MRAGRGETTYRGQLSLEARTSIQSWLSQPVENGKLMMRSLSVQTPIHIE